MCKPKYDDYELIDELRVLAMGIDQINGGILRAAADRIESISEGLKTLDEWIDNQKGEETTCVAVNGCYRACRKIFSREQSNSAEGVKAAEKKIEEAYIEGKCYERQRIAGILGLGELK